MFCLCAAHSCAPRHSRIPWQASITEQYTVPATGGDSSPATTATIALSSNPKAGAHPTRPHHGPALEPERQRDQVGVGDAPADRGCLGRRPPRSRVVTGHNLPEGAPGGPPEVAALGMELVGALQGRQAVLHTAEEIRGGRQQLQVR
jgi:hypothetical protein